MLEFATKVNNSDDFTLSFTKATLNQRVTINRDILEAIKRDCY